MSMPAVRHPGELRWEWRLLAAVAALLTVFGIANLFGAMNVRDDAFGAVLKQLLVAGAGMIGLVLLSRVDYRRLRALAWPLMGVTVALLLVLVLPQSLTGGIAPEINGARRWIRFPAVSVQPGELAKFVIVLWAAALAAKKGSQIRRFGKGVIPFVVGIGTLFLLIVLQPNLSTAVLVVMLGGAVLFTAGVKIGHFLLVVAVAGLVVAQLATASGYRRARLDAYFGRGSEDAAMQIQQSVVAIGSGGPFGLGFGEGRAKLAHVPLAQSDFLFSSIGEEWGFVGVVVVVLCFALFGWVGYRIARTAVDPFGQLLATGLTTAVCLTAFFHMGVTLDLMPTTGLTLPFMSAGGWSLLMHLLATGVLVSIGRMRGRPSRA